ncbi:hypothetical protein L7F22_064834 [Adiantum nelumboides]|nr:hypothetical protein [Adiantum nelumboides]
MVLCFRNYCTPRLSVSLPGFDNFPLPYLQARSSGENLTSRKPWSPSAVSESMYVASQQGTTPTSRQLTIFCGGQAHVFVDDVTRRCNNDTGWVECWVVFHHVESLLQMIMYLVLKIHCQNRYGKRNTVSAASVVDCGGPIASEVPPMLLHSHARSTVTIEGDA